MGGMQAVKNSARLGQLLDDFKDQEQDLQLLQDVMRSKAATNPIVGSLLGAFLFWSAWLYIEVGTSHAVMCPHGRLERQRQEKVRQQSDCSYHYTVAVIVT